ncbi:hypothetical protein KEM54_001385 [Ascosphaera aggregata]|nr:hypothetical protein KEM54_001385 [Ascosphaera aggregata]
MSRIHCGLPECGEGTKWGVLNPVSSCGDLRRTQNVPDFSGASTAGTCSHLGLPGLPIYDTAPPPL